MAHYGAYGPDKIYTVAEVKDLVTYANKRGKDDFFIFSLKKFHFQQKNDLHFQV